MKFFSSLLRINIERSLNALRGRSAQKEMPPKRRWRLLQVESAIACNLRCIMCPWREIAKNVENRGLMTHDIWESIRLHLADINSVDFTGGGEPLLQPKLAEWIAQANAAGCETGFLSNAAAVKGRKVAAHP
jgi:molybdenum cofactor biosynthesis enzyme MoaA